MREAVIVEAVRSPIGRRKGQFRDLHPVDMLGSILVEILSRTGVPAERVDDVIIGCVSQVGEQAVNVARNAWLAAGLPESVPGTTLDRQCGSSLQTLHFAAQGVMSGAYDIVIAGGVESMTRVPMMSTLTGPGSPLTDSLQDRYSLSGPWFNQAVGAEMIARQWGFSREELDTFSYESHQKAEAARLNGWFDGEICSISVKNADGTATLVSQDEGIRPDASLEKMQALQPAFPGLELITAGNASQISDGASAVMVMSKEMADELGLRPRARFVSFAVVGVNPVTMLTGPIPATQKVLKKAGLSVEDIDLFEVNEAFAPVVMSWQKETNAAWDKVNIHGGAIALGHPLGATGTRITATLLHALEKQNARYGLMAICEGGGMANATIIERL